MRSSAKGSLILGIIVATALGGGMFYRHYTNEHSGIQPTLATQQHKIIDFTLPDLDGKKRNVHEWDGHVLVLNFWATWCPPCRKETPMFVELQEKYRSKGVQFVGIAIDKKDKVQDFIDTFGVDYPILIGTNDDADAIRITKAYGNRFAALPYTVIIDRHGIIRLTHRGGITRTVAEKTIQSLL